MISIIIPLYNKEKFIAQTLQSVLEQTYTNFEVVIVNDGSTDNSSNIVKSITDNRIKLLSIKNSGVSVARNIGIKNAKNSWIAFLDADDYWAPTFLQEIVTVIKKHPENKIFATGRSLVYSNKTTRYKNEHLPKDGTTSKLNYFKVISNALPPINSSNSVIHKTLFEEKGYFNPEQKQHEDHDLWMRLCVNEKVVFINKNLSFYRKEIEQSASKRTYEALDFCKYINTILKVKNQLTDEEKHYFKQYYQPFLLISYIKNYKNYTFEEDQMVYTNIKPLVTGKYAFLLKLLKTIPYKNTYKILKHLKK